MFGQFLSEEQIRELLKPLDPSRVSKDGKGFAHLEAYDVRAHLNRIFGFGRWSSLVDEMVLIYETEGTNKSGKPAWSVAYRAKCLLMVDGGEYAEWAAGDATNYPSRADAHDQAIKTAESQALKRCAMNLGDQFGLSLYKNGSTDPVVREVVGLQHADSEQVAGLIDLFSMVADPEGLAEVAATVAGLDLSESDRAKLREEYAKARKRLGHD